MNRFPGKTPDMMSHRTNFPGFWDIAKTNADLKQQVNDQKIEMSRRPPISSAKQTKENNQQNEDEARKAEILRASQMTKKKLRAWFKKQIDTDDL